MKARNTSDLFELAKSAPAEISKSQVIDFITSIPNLPPPSSNWFQNFNLNSILMTTTAITLITSVAIYFSVQESKLPKQPEDSITPITTYESQDSRQSAIGKIASQDIPYTPTQPSENEDDQVHRANLYSSEVLRTLDSIEDQEEEVTPKSPYHNSVNIMNAGERTSFHPVGDNTAVSLSSSELKKLKSQLSKFIKQDQLKRTHGGLITIKYTTEGLYINHRELSGAMLKRYTDLLREFNILPGPNRRIVIDKKYVMVGDFTEDGFEGSALGKAMEIRFKESTGEVASLLHSVFKLRPGLIKQMEIIPLDEPDRLGGLFTQPLSSPQKHKALNSVINNDNILTDSTSDNDGHQTQVKISNRSIITLNKGRRNLHAHLNRKKLKSLKKDLYKVLVSHELIQKKGQDVRIVEKNGSLHINEQIPEENILLNIERLLMKYRITFKPQTKLLMNSNFLVVGKFMDGDFSGAVSGSISSTDLSKGFFSNDFKGISIFEFMR